MTKKVYRRVFFYSMLGLIIIGAVVAGYLLSIDQPIPEGKSGPAADSLALKMQRSLGLEHWDETKYIQWTFNGSHHFLWNKSADRVWVRWNTIEVLLDTKDLERSVVLEDGAMIRGEAAKTHIDKAWQMFCNDSFWLVAPFKAFDPGTTREVVRTNEAIHGLKVTYESGGVTPGDCYLWLLDKNYRPIAWRMWVDVIPVGGIKAEWVDWKKMKTGIWLPGAHSIQGYDPGITDLATGYTLSDLGYTEDPFAN